MIQEKKGTNRKIKKIKKVKISKLKEDPALERTFDSIVNSLRNSISESFFQIFFFNSPSFLSKLQTIISHASDD